MPPTRLHIDRLVLEGVDPRDAGAIAAAVRAELGRRLAETPPSEAATADQLTVNVPHARGARLGQSVANAVHGKLSGGPR